MALLSKSEAFSAVVLVSPFFFSFSFKEHLQKMRYKQCLIHIITRIFLFFVLFFSLFSRTLAEIEKEIILYPTKSLSVARE